MDVFLWHHRQTAKAPVDPGICGGFAINGDGGVDGFDISDSEVEKSGLYCGPNVPHSGINHLRAPLKTGFYYERLQNEIAALSD